MSRADLDVFPSFLGSFGFQRVQQDPEVLWMFGQRLAVVREWKGDQSPPGGEATDATKNYAVGEVDPWRSGRISHWLVCVRAPERLEPAWRVEYGGPRMVLREPRPTRIPKRIDAIDRGLSENGGWARRPAVDIDRGAQSRGAAERRCPRQINRGRWSSHTRNEPRSQLGSRRGDTSS